MRIKIYFLIICFLYQTNTYSKVIDDKKFNQKYLSNYLSALISFDNREIQKSVKYFNLSKNLVNEHETFLKEYIFALVANGEVSNAIKHIKYTKNKKYTNFFESKMLAVLESIKKRDFIKANHQLDELKEYKDNGTYQFVIYESLKSYNDLFLKKNLIKNRDFGKLSLINDALQSCYMNSEKTEPYFHNLINSLDGDYSRYKFFYMHNLIQNNQLKLVKQISSNINSLSSGLLLLQAKNWVDNNKFDKFSEYFSCQNENDILSEFFFLISNLYSTEEDFKNSKFYLKISDYLNPKFYFNISLEIENYFLNDEFDLARKSLDKIDNKNEIYNWYRIKKIAQIISKEKNNKQSRDFLENNYKKFKNPNIKIIYDMANIYKKFELYKKSIEYYSLVMSKVDKNSTVLANLLYRRGGSFERMNEYNKADKDLLKSLEIEPNEPYVLNYLAYSWLERNYKIEEAINMLKIAYEQQNEDPYIIDSIGWGYYLIGDYISAEKYIKEAVILMPDDPIVNDHYGDILWKLNRKLQAKYFWQSVLKLESTEKELKKKVSKKLLHGVSKI